MNFHTLIEACKNPFKIAPSYSLQARKVARPYLSFNKEGQIVRRAENPSVFPATIVPLSTQTVDAAIWSRRPNSYADEICMTALTFEMNMGSMKIAEEQLR